jgi:hypothetical protein
MLLTAGGGVSPKPSLEIWGLRSEDELFLDDRMMSIRKSNGEFRGDPLAPNAPFSSETTEGPHSVTVTRAECVPESFPVAIFGAEKHVIILQPPSNYCAVSPPPPRVDDP